MSLSSVLSHLTVFCHGKQMTYRQCYSRRQDTELMAHSQTIIEHIRKGRSRIGQVVFADFEYKLKQPQGPGRRFCREEKRRVLVLG